MSKRILLLSSYSVNLRFKAVMRELEGLGYDVKEICFYRDFGSPKELAFNIIPNIITSLFVKGDIAIGFKPYPSVMLPLLVLKMRGMRTIIDVDDLDHEYRTGILSKLIYWAEVPFVRFCDKVVYHNKSLKPFLISHMKVKPDKIHSFPQGVHYQMFDIEPDPSEKKQLIRKYKLEDSQVLLHAAHLNTGSDLEVIFDIWSDIGPQSPRAVLLIVGGGPLQGFYEKTVKEMELPRVIFTGEIPHENIPVYFSISDIALLYLSPEKPANLYRCSLKLREYFASGLKVVCNDCGELSEYKDFTYQGSSPESFSQALISVLKNGGDQREIKARELVKNHFQWPSLVRKLSELFVE
jgi:glycosyltransferase involved in cell wall biosynthesis